MSASIEKSEKKFGSLYLHIIICAALMIGCGYIPPDSRAV